MKKIVFLEGLPGVGKTTIIKKIKELNLKNVNAVDEIINPDILNSINSQNQNPYIVNDNMKINQFSEGLVLIDRGPISTFSYNIVKSHLNSDFSSEDVSKWFYFIKNNIYQSDNQVIYLKNATGDYYIPYQDDKDPYGSIENQKLLEQIVLDLLQKYVKNYKIIEYGKEDMERLIYEIID